MEDTICRILDEAQLDTKSHEHLASQLVDAIGTDMPLAAPVLQTCFDCVVVVSRNEQSVKNVMAFVGTFCVVASRYQTDNAVDAETGEAAKVTEVHPVPLWLLAYSVACSKAANKTVRMRGCEIGAIVMENLPEDADISELAWTASVNAVLDRLSDKQATVRLQAVRFAKRLQSPDDPEDPIGERLLEMIQDDTSVQVRKAAVQAVAVSDTTLDVILSRTRDVNEGVRVAALGVVMQDIPMTVLPIATRTKILDQALRDTSNSVTEAGVQLYTYWLQNEARGDVADFLTFLDVENLERDSTSILRSVINEVDANHALRNGPVGASLFNPATPFFERHPSGGALSVEKSFLCRLVCEHLHSAEGADSDRLEAVRPSMLDVSELLEATLAEDSISNEFVVRQVLLTVPYLDMQDESGRRQMVLQLKNFLLATDKTAEENVPAALSAFMAAYDNKQDFMRYMVELCLELREPIDEFGVENMAEAADALAQQHQQDSDADPDTFLLDGDHITMTVSEIWDMQRQLRDLRWREEEKDEVMEHEEEIEALTQALHNAPEVLRLQILWTRCLEIVAFLFEHSRSNLPELESLYTSCVLPGLQQACPEMREVAVKCLGLYSCLDIKDAETNLPLLYQFAMTDLAPIRLVALKCGADVLTIFPGLLANGSSVAMDLLSSFVAAVDTICSAGAARKNEVDKEDIAQQGDGETDDEENDGSEEDVLLGDEEEEVGEEMEIRNVAIKALAKFLLLGRLKKQPAMQKQVLAKLLVYCFVTDTRALPVELKQFLSVFFASYTHQSADVRTFFVNAVADVVASVSYAPSDSAYRTANISSILQYVTHVVTESANAAAIPSAKGSQDEADFLRARIVLDLLIELCAAPEQPHARELAKFVASVVSSSPGCCKQVALPLFWVAHQALKSTGGTAVSSLARKVIKATEVDPRTETDGTLPQFQPLRLRIMARRATVNSVMSRSRSSLRKEAATAATASSDNSAESSPTADNDSKVAAAEAPANTSSASATIAKSRAMLARMKKAVGQSRQGGTALTSIGNAATE